MVLTHIDVKLFNVMRYAITSLLLVPCLEWALQSIVESFAAMHLLKGGVVRWGGHRLGRLSPVPYSYDKATRFLALGACFLIHATSLLGEYGFDAKEIEMFQPTELYRTNASSVSAYVVECYRKDLQIHDLNNNFVSTKNITFSSIKECSEKRNEYSRARDYSYGVLNEELSNNLDSVSSTSTANADLDWQAGTCRSGEGGVGIYNFTVRPSKFRKYRNRTINLPLSYATTKVYVPYGCHAEFGSIYFKPHNLENVSTLRTTIDQRYFKLIQNETFTCLFARRFFEDFCFSNSTSSVRRLYRSYSAYGKFRPLVQVYLYAEFEPPVDVSRMYFILAGMRNYQPLNVELSAGVLTVSRSFSVEGNVLTLLTAMEEVLSPQGRNVISISHKRVVATIDKVGFAYLGLLSSVTLTTFLIAIIYICIAKKDARGRVVTVKSEPKYVIDLVANNIMESEDFAAPEVSEFGIALTSHGPDLHRICISRAGVVYKGGIVSGRPEQTHTRRRKRKRSSE